MPQRDSRQIEKVQLKNDEFIPMALSFLKEHRSVKLPLRGYSMRPFLENDRDCALLVLPHKPVLHEPVLVCIDGRWILHRIVKIEGEALTLLGDGNLTPEHCTVADIKASVEGFYRKGRATPDLVSGRKWRIYSFIWTKLYPIRRYLLFIYRILLKVGSIQAFRKSISS